MTDPENGGRPSMSARGPTRERLIWAAAEALGELSVPQLISAVGTREIARRAGVSAASLFHHFSTVDALAEALIARVFDPGIIPMTPLLDNMTELANTSLPLDAATIVHSSEFDRLAHDEMLRVRTGLWALGGADMDPVYDRYIRTSDERIASAVIALFDAWGSELRPPWEIRAYLRTQSSLLSGSVIRHLVGPAPRDRQDFVHAAVTLSLTSLRVKGFNHDVNDRLRELNHYPTRLDITPDTGEPARSTRVMILDAAADLFGKYGYERTKIGQIARGAGVSESSVYSHFESKRTLAAELFRSQTRSLAHERGVDTGLHEQVAPRSVDDVHRFATVIAECAHVAKEIAPAYLAEQSEVEPRTDWIVEHLSVLTGGRIANGHDADERAERASREIAQLVVIALLRMVLVLPDDTAAETASRVLGMFGIGAEPLTTADRLLSLTKERPASA